VQSAKLDRPAREIWAKLQLAALALCDHHHPLRYRQGNAWPVPLTDQC
jgi:hypothetical protein